MSTHIMNPVRGKRIRITELDACGHPPTSGGTSIVSDGFITVTLTSEKEDGAEIIQKITAEAEVILRGADRWVK